MRLLSTLLSVLAAFFGVQSNKNRQRDFSQGKAAHFILISIIATLLFIIMLVGIVNWVLT